MPTPHFSGSAAPEAVRPFSRAVLLSFTGGFVGFVIAAK
jgi:hypothetical protein